eukprot:175386-Prymnesium_polylepis.2
MPAGQFEQPTVFVDLTNLVMASTLPKASSRCLMPSRAPCQLRAGGLRYGYSLAGNALGDEISGVIALAEVFKVNQALTSIKCTASPNKSD